MSQESSVSRKQDAKHDGSDLTISVSAPGKVILFGEHSVVYEKLAIAASIDLRTYVTLKQNSTLDGENCLIKFEDIDAEYTFSLQRLKTKILANPFIVKTTDFDWLRPQTVEGTSTLEKVKEFIAEENLLTETCKPEPLLVSLYLLACTVITADIELGPFELTIKSDVTPGSGTGSSASFAVCLTAAFVQAVKMKLRRGNNGLKHAEVLSADMTSFDENELCLICEWAFQAERIVHGNPSGVDNTVCTYGNVVQYRRGVCPTLLTKGLQIGRLNHISVLLVNTKVPKDTKQQVARVAAKRSQHPATVDAIMHAMDELAKDAAELLAFIVSVDMEKVPAGKLRSSYERLTELVSMNHNLLRALDVSHPKLDEICSVLSQYGLCGKLTGAGGGGNVVCIVPPFASRALVQEVTYHLNSKGFYALLVSLGGEGVRVE